MKRLRVGLVFLALSFAPLAAEEPEAPPPAKGEAEDELELELVVDPAADDDDDLLDPDLDGDAGPAVPEPPLEEKTRIDDEAVSIGREADRYGDELRELSRLLRDRQTEAEARRRLEERLADAERQLAGLRTQVEGLERRLARDEPGRRRTRASYGTPLDFDRLPRRGRRRVRPQSGDEQFAWWQKLILKGLDGLHAGLKKLAEKRANALKARADALALATDPRYRPYADAAVRDAVGDSRFAQPIYDRRLDDLSLRPVPARAAPVPRRTTGRPARAVRETGPTGPVVLLPRRRGPNGRLVPVVDLPLGGPFVVPSLSPADSPGFLDEPNAPGSGAVTSPIR
ncbi:MAG: hypothetical protein D6731_06250 [Planctomycetota bacterium]|nr:MAG: hypothetical protein D6731_06250 [Planctomycetota bacterium]